MSGGCNEGFTVYRGVSISGVVMRGSLYTELSSFERVGSRVVPLSVLYACCLESPF